MSFGAGACASVVKRVLISRTVSGGLVGTSHARPQAFSVVAAAIKVVATSGIEVQLCGTSNAAGT